MNSILVAADGSPAALAALRLGIELARDHAARLVVAHVVPEFDVVPATPFQLGGVFPRAPGALDTQVLDDAEALAGEHDVGVTPLLLRGETVEALLEYADLHDIGLIVVGSRGHGPVTGTLLGSVSLALLRRSPRPVVIVRAPGEAPQKHSVVHRNPVPRTR